MQAKGLLVAGLGAVCVYAASAAAQTPPARPAAPSATPAGPPAAASSMKVRLVRSSEPGCEPDCPEWISAQGQIDHSTPAEFRRVLARIGNRKLPILIDSIGGSVDPSLVVGRMIRAKGLDVVVTKTVLTPCDPREAACRSLKAKGVEPGRPEARISRCASSCAFILAGGVRRYVGAWTVVGLHEIKSIATRRLIRQHYRLEPRYAWGVPVEPRKTIVKEEVLRVDTREGPADEKTYDRIRAYFAEMGVGDSIMPILRSTPNSSIRWVRIAELKATGLATDFLNGEQLLMPAVAATNAVAAPAQVPPSACSDADKSKPPCTTGSTGAAPAGAAATASATGIAAAAAAAPPLPPNAAPPPAKATAAASADPKPKPAARPTRPRPTRADNDAQQPFGNFQN